MWDSNPSSSCGSGTQSLITNFKILTSNDMIKKYFSIFRFGQVFYSNNLFIPGNYGRSQNLKFKYLMKKFFYFFQKKWHKFNSTAPMFLMVLLLPEEPLKDKCSFPHRQKLVIFMVYSSTICLLVLDPL